MRSRNRDAGTLRRVLDFDHIEFDVVGRMEHLTLHLLRLRQHGIAFSEADGNAVAVDIQTLHDTSHQIMLFFKVIVIDDLPLFFANLLQNHILCDAARDAAKLPRFNFDRDHIIDLIMRINHLGIGEGDIQRFFVRPHLGRQLLHYDFFLDYAITAAVSVDINFHIVGSSVIILAGTEQRVLNRLQQ